MPGMRATFVTATLAASLAAGACSSSHSSTSGGNRAPAVTSTSIASSAVPTGTISHDGRWLTDTAGRVVMLHGVNMVEKSPPYYPSAAGFGEDDAAWIERHGFNVVRLGVLPTGLMPQPGRIDATYLDHLATTVDLLARHHLYVLLDFHQDGWGPSIGDDGFPSWMTLTGDAVNSHTTFPLYYATNPAIQQAFQSFWDNTVGPGGTRLQDRFSAMLRALGSRFATDSNVLGYDVFNEPWPGTTWSACVNDPNGCPALDRRELDSFYGAMSGALRTVDRNHLLFVEPFVLFNFGESKTHVALPGRDPHSGLSFHVYALDTAHEPNVIQNAEEWSRTTTGALLSTEWGATSDPGAITRQAGELDAALVPWIFWSYDALVTDLRRPPGSGAFPAAAASALARPYASVVAGTPTASSFDAQTRTLQFAWSTSRPGGGGTPAGTVTSFEIPASAYPSGYAVVVKGAVVTSKPCAALLTVAALPGNTSAVARITPGSGCSPNR
jgi:endoglycosylceramidase